MCLCEFWYHLCAPISCHCSSGHRAHLWRNVMQAGVGCSCSAQLSVNTRVGNHSKRTGVRAGHCQRRTETRSCKTKRCLIQGGTFESEVILRAYFIRVFERISFWFKLYLSLKSSHIPGRVEIELIQLPYLVFSWTVLHFKHYNVLFKTVFVIFVIRS